MYKIFNTERFMRWRLILENFSAQLIYIQGSKDITSDTFSRLNTTNSNNPITSNMPSSSEQFSLEKDNILRLINHKTIMQYQQNYK